MSLEKKEFEYCQEERYDEKLKSILYFNIFTEYESIIRQEEKTEIIKKLLDHTPVIIYGHSGVGKTSMMRSIETEYYSGQTLYIDFKKFKRQVDQKMLDSFLIDSIADFITQDLKNRKIAKNMHRLNMYQQSLSPFEYLNQELIKKNKNILVSLDECLRLRKIPSLFKTFTVLEDSQKTSNIACLMSCTNVDGYQKYYQSIFKNYHELLIANVSLSDLKLMIHTEQKKYNVKISIEENVYETIYGMFGNDLPTIKRFLENFAKFHHAKNKSIVASKKMIEEFYYSTFLDGDLFHNCYEALMVRIKANFYVLWNKCQLKMFQDLAYKKITNYDQLDLLQQKNISPLLEHEMVKQKKNGELSLNGDIYYQLFKGRLKHILTDYIYDSEQTKENYKDCFEWI